MCAGESPQPEDKVKKISANKEKRLSLSLLSPPMAIVLRAETLQWERVFSGTTLHLLPFQVKVFGKV